MILTSILILIVAKALPSLSKNITSKSFTRISTIIFIYAGVLSLNTLYIQSIGSGIGIYSGLFQITPLSLLIESFLLFIGSLILIAWPRQFKIIPNNKPSHMILTTCSNNYKSDDYSLIVLFSTLGSCLLISCFDLVSLYICIELQSFGVYVLSTLYKESESSTKAGLKYFLLGALSSCIILLGCGLIYSYTGLTNFDSIYSIISTANSISCFNNYGIDLTDNASAPIQGLTLGIVLIFIGFLFKIAAAPLHNWSPDVYSEVPTIVTIWLTIIPKIAILILLLELQFYGFNLMNISDSITLMSQSENTISNSTIFNFNYLNSLSEVVKNLLLISSLLSLLLGSIVGLAQTSIKRLLAYSTINHIGFILLALAINSESSIDAFIFYIIQYTISNLNIFFIILALSYITASSPSSIITNKGIRDIRYITELKGQIYSNPILSLSLAICLFSMAGLPPLIGFFSKQYVLYSAIQNGYYFISIIAILVSVISASYYLKIVKVIADDSNINLLQENNTEDFTNNNFEDRNNYVYLSNVHSYLISVLTLVILLFILKPSLILNSTQLLSLNLFNW